jgi:hypothetical protein
MIEMHNFKYIYIYKFDSERRLCNDVIIFYLEIYQKSSFYFPRFWVGFQGYG